MIFHQDNTVLHSTVREDLGDSEHRVIFPNPSRACSVPQSNPETPCLNILEQVHFAGIADHQEMSSLFPAGFLAGKPVFLLLGEGVAAPSVGHPLFRAAWVAVTHLPNQSTR